MVEGADVGEEFETGDGQPRTEVFQGADLVCVDKEFSYRYKSDDKANEPSIKGRALYAIYGNNIVVESFMLEEEMGKFSATHPKSIMVRKKPYILNGESGTLYISYRIQRDAGATRRPTNAHISIQTTNPVLNSYHTEAIYLG